MKNIILLLSFCTFAGAGFAQTYIDITGVGKEKKSLSINVSGVSAQAFIKSLTKNLEFSNAFVVRNDGQIKVSGTTTSPRAVYADKMVSGSYVVSDDKSSRMAARDFANRICEAFAGQKGFALDKIAFISKKPDGLSELCVCYPDGLDIRQLTANNERVIGPRWKDENTIFYTGIVNAGPQIWEYDTVAQKRTLRWSFKGLTTGAVISPDGTRVAIILSFQGNPELYVINLDTKKWERLTITPNASEGCPAWSPDGKKIVYVSNEDRRPQLYIIDVATKKKRRITFKGSQNVEPDWGNDGRIVYITKRGAAQVAVMDPAEGEASVKLLTPQGFWERPSWSRDNRNIIVGQDKALFIVDSAVEDGRMSTPQRIFYAKGNWINPSWAK
jgi:TolB protein